MTFLNDDVFPACRACLSIMHAQCTHTHRVSQSEGEKNWPPPNHTPAAFSLYYRQACRLVPLLVSVGSVGGGSVRFIGSYRSLLSNLTLLKTWIQFRFLCETYLLYLFHLPNSMHVRTLLYLSLPTRPSGCWSWNWNKGTKTLNSRERGTAPAQQARHDLSTLPSSTFPNILSEGATVAS
jgi:hypothetical protein